MSQDDRFVARIAAKGQVGEHEMPVHEETQRLGISFVQVEVPRNLPCDPSSHFTMVFGVAFTQVVDQQRQMEQLLCLDVAIGA